MDKKYLIIAGVLLLIILGLGGMIFISSRSKKNIPASTSVETTIPSPEPTVAQPKSLRDLLSMGTSQQCSFSTGAASNSAIGTIYISSGKVRGDIVTAIAGKNTNTHMIVDGSTSYIWTDDSANGFKMSFNPVTPSGTAAPSQPGSINPDQAANYNCSAWSSDSSLFTLPANIKFSDLSNIVIPTVSVKVPVSPSAANCSACNYLSGASKTQCLTAMGCAAQ